MTSTMGEMSYRVRLNERRDVAFARKLLAAAVLTTILAVFGKALLLVWRWILS